MSMKNVSFKNNSLMLLTLTNMWVQEVSSKLIAKTLVQLSFCPKFVHFLLTVRFSHLFHWFFSKKEPFMLLVF